MELRSKPLTGARWLLLALLPASIWAYGGESYSVSTAFAYVLLITFGVWILGCALLKKLPRVGASLWGIIGALLLYGWFSAWFLSIASSISAASMLRWSALLAVVPIAADLAGNPLWQRRVWNVIAGNAAAWALFGLMQKAGGIQMIYNLGEPVQEHFFATFHYHGNAASYLLLGLALVLGRLAVAISREERSMAEMVPWSGAAMLLLGALLVNTSRGGHLLTILLLIGAVALFRAGVCRGWARTKNRPDSWLAPTAIGICILTLLLSMDWQRTRERWSATFARIDNGELPLITDGRAKARADTVRVILESPWFGHGPGTFDLVFPLFRTEEENRWGLWKYAHNDYLQITAEWGTVGGALWAVFVIGALLKLAARKRLEDRPQSEEWIFLRTLALAILVLLAHAFFDYPLQVFSLQLHFLVLLGVAWGILSTNREKRVSHEHC